MLAVLCCAMNIIIIIITITQAVIEAKETGVKQVITRQRALWVWGILEGVLHWKERGSVSG